MLSALCFLPSSTISSKQHWQYPIISNDQNQSKQNFFDFFKFISFASGAIKSLSRMSGLPSSNFCRDAQSNNDLRTCFPSNSCWRGACIRTINGSIKSSFWKHFRQLAYSRKEKDSIYLAGFSWFLFYGCSFHTSNLHY